MPVLDITVSLAEILEVQGTPIKEPEIWAILCQSTELLQDLFIRGEAVSGASPTFEIRPDTLLLCANGKLRISNASRTAMGYSPAAPETLGHMVMSDTAIEKIYVFSLGRSLYEAATYGLRLDQTLNLSRGLDTLLDAMCEEDPSVRVALVHVMEACAVYSERHPTEPGYSQSVSRLYKSVLGGAEDEEDGTHDSTYGSDQSRHGTLNLSPRSRRQWKKPRHSRFKDRHKDRSLSRSPSRSRSRSRSPQRHNRRRENFDQSYQKYGDSFNRHYFKASSGYHSSNMRGGNQDTKFLPPDFSVYDGNAPYSPSQSKPVNHVNQTLSPRYIKAANHMNGHRVANMGHPAYEKYLKLKERQRKLRALRQGLFGEDIEEDRLFLTPGMDRMSDTRSLLSQGSCTQGMYMPDIHPHYGSQTALKLGLDSDRDSIISSEISIFNQDNTMRAVSSDTVDPFIQSLQHISPSLHTPPIGQGFNHSSSPPQESPQQQRTSKETKTTPNKPREFVGPEFVYRSTKPIARIPMPLQGESMKNPAHARRVVVVLLTGQKLEVMCDPCTTGQQLFEAVVTHISLPEFFYMGLTYINDGEHFFIESDMKLHKVAPSGWKDSGKGNMATITFTIYLRMKYYVDNLITLRHHVTRHLLYLQLRRDILEDRTQCSEDKALTLAGLSLQVEYGNYDKEMNGRSYFVPEHYFSHRVIQRVGTAYVRDNGAEMHAAARDITEAQAEMDFIREVQKLPEYGVHFYKLFKNKNDTNNPIWIGIATSCLLIAESMGNQRSIVHQHPWGKTQKISFKKRRFSVQPKTDYGQAKPLKMNFYTNSYKKGRYLLQFSTAQHRFLLKMKARAADPDLHDIMMDSVSVGEDHIINIGGEDDLEAQFADDEGLTSDADSHRMGSASPQAGRQTARDEDVGHSAVTYINPPLYRSDQGVSMEELRELYSIDPSKRPLIGLENGDRRLLHDSNHGSNPHGAERRMGEYDAYTSSPILGQFSQPLPNDSSSTALHERVHKEFLSPVSLDRDIFEVTLRKEPHVGIGITIVGGENTDRLDLGIFVKTVCPDSPADLEGRIKPGDRIIAINGHSLEGKQHHIAVKLIQQAVDEVKLLVSQVRQPKTIRRKDYGDTSVMAKLHMSVNSDNDVNIFNELNSHNDITNQSEPSSGVDGALNAEYLHRQYNSRDIPGNHRSSVLSLTSDSSAHSRMSARDSIKTESLPDDERYSDTENSRVNPSPDYRNDSSTDSDFDDAIETIVNGKHKPGNDTFSVKRPGNSPNRPEITKDLFEVDPIVLSTDRIFLGKEYKDVKLQKQIGTFGFKIKAGKGKKSKDDHIIVSGLLPGGAAEQEGTIEIGDRIISVNGTSLSGSTRREVSTFLSSSPDISEFRIAKPHKSVLTPPDGNASSPFQHDSRVHVPAHDQEDSVDNSPYNYGKLDKMGKKYFPFVKKDNIFKVELNKGSGGVGLCISCVEDNHPNDPFQGIVWVKQVSPFGPAAASQKFKQGDIILEVNHQQLKGMMKSENRLLLRTASNPVKLMMCRPRPDLIPPWLQRQMDESFLSTTPMSSVSATSISTFGESESEKASHNDQVIAPPAQFSSPRPPDEYNDDSQEYDEYGDVFCRPASPPPVPRSSPPTLHDSSQRTTPLDEFVNSNELHIDITRCDNLNFDTENDNTPRNINTIDEDIVSEFTQLCNKEDTGVDFPEFRLSKNQHEEVYISEQSNSLSCDARTSAKEAYIGNVNGESSRSAVEDKYPDMTFVLGKTSPQGTLSLDQIDIGTYELSESSGSRSGSPLLSIDMPSSDGEETEPLKPGELEVTMTKRDSGGLGFTVAGGASTTGGCFIKGIVQDPALSDGRLRPGDKLIKVNGYDMTSLSHFEAVTLLRQAPQVVTIRVCRDPDLWESTDISATSASEETLFDGAALIARHFPSPGKQNGTVASHLSLASSEKLILDEHSSESVKDLPPDGEKRVQGAISSLCFEPQETNNKNNLHSDAENYRGISCSLSSPETVLSPLDDAMSKLNLSDMGIERIELDKPVEDGLGFSLVTAESDRQTGIFIKSLNPNGVAAEDGRLRPGDRLLQINEESLVGLNHTKAIAMLKKISGRVILTVSRSFSHKLEWTTLSDSEREVSQSSAHRQPGANADQDTTVTDISSCENTDGEDDNVDTLVAEAEQYLRESETINLEQSQLNSITLSPIQNKSSSDLSAETHELTGGIDIPELPVITEDWLSRLPLVTIPKVVRLQIPSLIECLQEKIEANEPMDEFMKLRKVKDVDSWDVAKQTQNKSKNRFRNVLPYDKNRVQLTGVDNYINASYIKMTVATKETHYIASQGPLPQTADEFWIMVWEQRSNVVAMLTQDMEARKVKCHRYWPDFVEVPLLVSKNNHDLEVSLLSLQTTDNMDIRLVEMKDRKTHEQHQVYHLVYMNWPDHGVPDSALPLLQYLRLVHILHQSGPIIVHCSAGIGRTGTFITVDTALTSIEEGQECNIFEIVKELRKQRSGMIQTKDQYMFCFCAFIEALLSSS